MIITEIEHGSDRKLLIFFMLNSADCLDVSDWIKRKACSVTGYDMDKISSLCEQKFGERPHIVNISDIPAVSVS